MEETSLRKRTPQDALKDAHGDTEVVREGPYSVTAIFGISSTIQLTMGQSQSGEGPYQVSVGACHSLRPHG